MVASTAAGRTSIDNFPVSATKSSIKIDIKVVCGGQETIAKRYPNTRKAYTLLAGTGNQEIELSTLLSNFII